ncbi:MAG: ankyrin repeat domain-containing protein [Candidatus Babeliaceae bacterium]
MLKFLYIFLLCVASAACAIDTVKIFDAIRQGNIEQLKILLDEVKAAQQDINTILDADGNTVLHIVAEGKSDGGATRRDIIKLLIRDYGANSRLKNNQNMMPHNVLRTNQSTSNAFRYLLGTNPLHWAIDEKDSDTLHYLLKTRQELLQQADLFGKTPLFYAIEAGNIDMAKELLKSGADINTSSKFGDTLLDSITIHQDVTIAKFLLEHGARITAKAILSALGNKNFALVQLFFDKGGQRILDEFILKQFTDLAQDLAILSHILV